MKLSIIIPCYNEALNIPLILKRFSEVIQNRNVEVILVNNGSTDNSAKVLDEQIPAYTFAKTVIVPVNKGYGYGIIQGLKQAVGDYIGWTHADMQTDPGDVIKAYDIIQQSGNDNIFLKGKRKGRPFFDRIFTNGMSVFESLFFGMCMTDINAQPNIFPISFFKSLENPPHDFSLDLFIFYMAKKMKLNIIRFPVEFPQRIHGKSKWNTDGFKSKWKFIKRIVEFSVELKRQL